MAGYKTADPLHYLMLLLSVHVNMHAPYPSPCPLIWLTQTLPLPMPRYPKSWVGRPNSQRAGVYISDFNTADKLVVEEIPVRIPRMLLEGS